jgi:hypothetical protein
VDPQVSIAEDLLEQEETQAAAATEPEPETIDCGGRALERVDRAEQSPPPEATMGKAQEAGAAGEADTEAGGAVAASQSPTEVKAEATGEAADEGAEGRMLLSE